MRFVRQLEPAFVVGFFAGIAAAGVTFLAGGALRRMRARRVTWRERIRFIDREPDSVERLTRPTEDANTSEQPPRLESEIPEFSPTSQRW